MDALITTNKDDFEKISRILIQLEIKRKKRIKQKRLRNINFKTKPYQALFPIRRFTQQCLQKYMEYVKQ